MAEPQPRSIMVAVVAQESKWSLFHQLGSHGEGRVPRPPVQTDSLGASGPYGHNTLTGLYSTPYSFNQSKAHILCFSLHDLVCLDIVFTLNVSAPINVFHSPSALVLVYIEDSNLALYAERLQNNVVDQIEKYKYFISVYLLAVLSSQQKLQMDV